MAGINLSLRTIERNVSGSYNVGSLRLNADNKLEHVNSHVFKANNDHVTKEQSAAVRQAINSSFRAAYARNSATNADLGTALNDVQKFLLGDGQDDETLHTELSRDEVRALLKGLYRINKGGTKNIAEGKRWIEKAKVIRELKAGSIYVGNDYNLICKNDRGSTVLGNYKSFCGIEAHEDVKLSKDFLRGCWKTGTTERWNRAIKSGTGAKKCAEIVTADTPEKVVTWLKDRLVLGKDDKVSIDTKGWGPRSCQMAKVIENLLQQKYSSWRGLHEDATGDAKLQKLNRLFDEYSKSLFVDSTVFHDFFRTEHSLSPFSESLHKKNLQNVLLNNYNVSPNSGNFPGLHKDFIRVCAANLKGWLNVHVSDPEGGECPYDFQKVPSSNLNSTIKAGDVVSNEIAASNEDMIRKLSQIKNEKVRKMVSYTVSNDFPADLFGRTEHLPDRKVVIVGGKPFSAYQKAVGKTILLPLLDNNRPDIYGKVNITVNNKEDKVEMTIRRSVAPVYTTLTPKGPITLTLKDSVCVEYKVTISPANGPGEPNVKVTSAKLLPNVKEIKPDV